MTKWPVHKKHTEQHKARRTLRSNRHSEKHLCLSDLIWANIFRRYYDLVNAYHTCVCDKNMKRVQDACLKKLLNGAIKFIINEFRLSHTQCTPYWILQSHIIYTCTCMQKTYCFDWCFDSHFRGHCSL